jgi:predicted Zn-dependent peptidase
VQFERYVLPNGLTVILHEDHALPRVTVNLWFGVGSAVERPGRSGFAHLFEHLMFMGTEDVPNGAFDTVMEAYGGMNNASTSNDRTNYYETGPSSLLETFLFLEADRLRHLPDAMTKAKVDLQRDVVKNERRQSYENQPYGQQELIVMDRLFPAAHPYHHPVIGSHADLTAASVDDVKAFFRSWYVTTNASLVVAGDFDPTQARAAIEKSLGQIPRAQAPVNPVPPLTELAAPVRVIQADHVKDERVVLAWLAPGDWAPGSAACDLLQLALAGGRSARLTRALVDEQHLAAQVSVDYEALRGVGVFQIVATAQGGHTAAQLEKAIDVELARLAAAPITDAELSRARTQVELMTLRQLESATGRADELNHLELRLGDPGEVERSSLARYEAIDVSTVAEWARRVLGKPRLTLSFIPTREGK